MKNGNFNSKIFIARVSGSPDSLTFRTKSNIVPIATPKEEKTPTPKKNGGNSSEIR
jgi:hypothetical protein